MKDRRTVYEELFAHTNHVAFRLGEDGTVRFVTPNISIHGYDPSQMIGRHYTQFLAPQERTRVGRFYAAALQRVRTDPRRISVPFDGTVYLMRGDQTTLSARVSGSGSSALNRPGERASANCAFPVWMAFSTSDLSRRFDAAKRAVKCRCCRSTGGSVSTGLPSANHFGKPPFF